MEVQIPLSVKIKIAENKANINDIARTIEGLTRKIGRYLMEPVLKQYEEVIVAALCEGKAILTHHRKGRPGRPCQGRKGGTWRERGFTTILGEVKVKLAEVRCKACGMRLRLLLSWLKLPPYQREEMGIR